ncbi:MAG: polysaccharide biosynthesis/export family protein [Flavipsychrobacter sp.]
MYQRIGLSLRSYCLWLILIFGIIGSSSCGNVKKIPYFKDVPDTLSHGTYSVDLTPYKEPLIQSNDILNITIETIDPRATEIFQIGSGLSGAPTTTSTASMSGGIGGASMGVASNNMSSGYLVDQQGYVDMPLVGKVKIGGLTTTQARDLIEQKATVYYKDPVVNVRFANFTFTLLGEVTRPGRYTVNNEKISLIDAVGMGGDLTPYGKRYNVMLVREENGKKVFARYNLNSTDVFQSPYYYLRQNDIVYVEQNRAKARSSTVDQTSTLYITYAVSIITLLLAFSSRFPNL